MYKVCFWTDRPDFWFTKRKNKLQPTRAMYFFQESIKDEKCFHFSTENGEEQFKNLQYVWTKWFVLKFLLICFDTKTFSRPNIVTDEKE